MIVLFFVFQKHLLYSIFTQSNLLLQKSLYFQFRSHEFYFFNASYFKKFQINYLLKMVKLNLYS
jgi:hypothetical protein